MPEPKHRPWGKAISKAGIFVNRYRRGRGYDPEMLRAKEQRANRAAREERALNYEPGSQAQARDNRIRSSHAPHPPKFVSRMYVPAVTILAERTDKAYQLMIEEHNRELEAQFTAWLANPPEGVIAVDMASTPMEVIHSVIAEAVGEDANSAIDK